MQNISLDNFILGTHLYLMSIRKVVYTAFRSLSIVFAIISWEWIFNFGRTTPSATILPSLSDYKFFTLGRLHYYLANTFTNSLMLCLIMGALGAEFRHSLQPKEPRALNRSIIMSFIVYLMFLSGSYVFLSDPITDLVNATPVQYGKMGVAISILSFIAGWNPGLFKKSVEKTIDMFEGKNIDKT